MSNLQKSVLKARLPPMVPISRLATESDKKRGRPARDYNPKLWSEYFKEQRDVETENGSFRVYLSSEPTEQGPLIVLLHGGGFSALTWSLFTTEISAIIHCQCLAIDLRGHGDSTSNDDTDLSAPTLAKDVGDVLAAMYTEGAPPILLIGHSMGGAISVHIADMLLIPTLIGVTVIDVVEGTAMDALASMQSFLRSRPTHFKTIQQAIEWSVRSGQIRNTESACVSMPGQIVNTETNLLSTNELPLVETPDCSDTLTTFVNPLSIPEDAEDTTTETEAAAADDGPSAAKMKPPAAPGAPLAKYTWRIDLAKSEKFWEGWFRGLSEKFLELPVPKLLLLASIDGLDRSLTVGQMQGKFQMQVLARCGHAVHEDRPHEVAEVVGSYLVRNKFALAAGDFIQQMPSC